MPQPPPQTQDQPTVQASPQINPLNLQTLLGGGNFSLEDLKKILTLLEGGAATLLAQAPSPFSAAVRNAPLPIGYKNVSDLKFHGNSDPVKFMGRFTMEMDVYQMPDLV